MNCLECEEYDKEKHYCPKFCSVIRGAMDDLHEYFVPVIRCKDCQYWMKNPYRESSVFGLCFKHKDIAIATDETDWCSWAERKEE